MKKGVNTTWEYIGKAHCLPDSSLSFFLVSTTLLNQGICGPRKKTTFPSLFCGSVVTIRLCSGQWDTSQGIQWSFGVHSDREPTRPGRHIPFSSLLPPTSSLKHDRDVWTCSFHPEQLWKPCTKVVIKKDRRAWKPPFQPSITLFHRSDKKIAHPVLCPLQNEKLLDDAVSPLALF